MAKFIVFCADGTWNGPDCEDADHDNLPDITNVLKLYRRLECDSPVISKDTEQECALTSDGSTQMVAKYLHGVGHSDNKLVQALGGAFGAGIIARIVRGYTFISRNYQKGDRIILVGFSRGAYTVRALAGMICAMGLLDAGEMGQMDQDAAYQAGTATWSEYRRKKWTASGLFVKVTDFLKGFTKYLATHATEENAEARLDAVLRPFDGYLGRAGDSIHRIPVESIEAVAVWDTVGALGIPFYDRNRRVDVFRFADTDLSGCVKHGYHAVSVDEARTDFTPTLWTPDVRVEQALFPGAHSDVGGGYPVSKKESGLSDHALIWMIRKLEGLGLGFADGWSDSLDPDAEGCAHEPWRHCVMLTAPRQFPTDPKIDVHQSLRDRLGKSVKADPKASESTYEPGNLTGYLS
ncbi:DUF2235 domain-containing protein [Fundidesulfovibrio agrisoli]|uniref:DUF2235 domain-containing protein n=1 Tax=Fundidesulfovibrio agrisoli TaxID=2922717 RepID=UPI001FADEB84|nr:DUF2235 domain-containing protein [Fundidesulfovibrio agrisoli]